jgi:hypothetical protein
MEISLTDRLRVVLIRELFPTREKKKKGDLKFDK